MLNQNLNRLVSLGFILVFGLMVAIGCSSSESNSSTGPEDVDGVNTNPTVDITAPIDGTIYDEEDFITFACNSSDNEDGALTGNSLSWTSNTDGLLGVGTTLTINNLSTGTHIVTLVATDSGGASASDLVTVAVNPEGNTIPTAEITSPSDQDEFEEGTNITFTGTGNDIEDGALTGGDLIWRSSIDGVLGTGVSINNNDLSVGTHTITLTATDSSDIPASDSITIIIITESSTSIADQLEGSWSCTVTRSDSHIEDNGKPVGGTYEIEITINPIISIYIEEAPAISGPAQTGVFIDASDTNMDEELLILFPVSNISSIIKDTGYNDSNPLSWTTAWNWLSSCSRTSGVAGEGVKMLNGEWNCEIDTGETFGSNSMSPQVGDEHSVDISFVGEHSEVTIDGNQLDATLSLVRNSDTNDSREIFVFYPTGENTAKGISLGYFTDESGAWRIEGECNRQ